MTAPPKLFPASPARLGTWLDCPRLYRFRYVDKPQPSKMPPTAAASWGNTIHLALKRWFDLPAEERTEPAAASLVCESWVEAGWRDEVQRATWTAAAINAVAAYVAALLRDGVPETAGLERGVAAKYGTMALTGRVDRIDRRGDELVVVDYKTGRVPPTDDDARGSLALAVYAYATWRTLRRRCVTVELHHVPTGTVASHVHDDDTLRRHLDRADDIAQEASAAADFPARPGTLCASCDFLHHCDAGLARTGGVLPQPWDTLERRTA